MRIFTVLTAVVVLGCGGSEATDDGGADADLRRGAMVRFAVTASGPMAWDAVPFPSDLHLDSDGRVNLGAMPVEIPIWDGVREDLHNRHGSCADCGAWFPIEGEIDPDSLPAPTSPGDTPSINDVAVLMEVDPTTAEAPLVPVDVGWVPTRGVVAVTYHHALEPGRRYALALTDALRGADGTPLAPWPLFEEVRDLESGGGAEADRARPLVRDALDQLEAAGLDRERIAGLAVFTVDDLSPHLLALKAAVDAAPTPVATVDRVYLRDDGGVDLLFGTTESTEPGPRDPAPGTEGTRAYRHETTLAVVLGRFESPRVVEGSGDELGFLIRNADGLPTAGSETETVPFMLIVPDAPLDTLPVLIFHHAGISELNRTAVLADTAGRYGVAVLASEAFLHGSRSTDANDVSYNMRGSDFLPGGETTGDGVSEHGTDVAFRIYGLMGVPEDQEGSPRYFVSGSTQTLVDAMTAVRFAREGDVSAIAASAPALASLSFGSGPVFFSGWSLGATVGSVVAVAEPDLAGAVLVGAPAAIARAACLEGGPLESVLDSILFARLGITGDRGRARCFDPLTMLYGWAIEPVDPAHYAPMLLRKPIVDGPRPDVLIQYAADDSAIPRAEAARYLRAAGVPAVGELGPLVASASLPLSGNVETPTGSVTAGAYLFPDAEHDLLVKPTQGSTEVPNPIVEVHAQIEHFLSTRLADERAEIIDP